MNPRMDSTVDWEEKFTTSRQAALKLDIALGRLLEDSQLSEHWKQVYREYLSARVRPALLRLIEQRDARRLRRFLEWNLATLAQCRQALEQSGTDQAEIRLLLMGLDAPQPPQSVLTVEEAAKKAWELTGESLAQEILYLHLFFTDFEVNSASGFGQTGTDGLRIYLQASEIVQYFREGCLRELYLHMMLHILYGHLLLHEKYPRALWDLSCDVSAWVLREKVFDLPLTLGSREESLVGLKGLFSDFLNPEDAAAVCGYLLEHPEKQKPAQLFLSELPGDVHDYWDVYAFESKECSGGEGGEGIQGAAGERYLERLHRKLTQAAAWMQQHRRPAASRRFGLAPGSRRDLLELKKEGQYDFRQQLKRFASVREELQTDEDSFDYIYYVLGLQRYGNMPLIEPLEYMETQRVEELVIAIDTSGSCSVEVVRRFLEETRNLLTRRENFFRKMNVHIIQCDSIIQQHQVITSVEDWQRYERELTIEGRGGTDFGTVFVFVEKLRAAGMLKKLKGLLYFTDGDGIYPENPTDYETFFVLSRRDFVDGEQAERVPKWAGKLYLEIPEKGNIWK